MAILSSYNCNISDLAFENMGTHTAVKNFIFHQIVWENKAILFYISKFYYNRFKQKVIFWIKNLFNASDLIFTCGKCHMLLFLVI